MKPLIPLSAAFLVGAGESRAEFFGGMDFPPGRGQLRRPRRGCHPRHPPPAGPIPIRPADALGPPDDPGGNDQPGSFSLGSGGSVVPVFTNNLPTGSNSPAEVLQVFEMGSDVEDTCVETEGQAAALSAPSLATEFFLGFPSAAGSTHTIERSPGFITRDDVVPSVPGTGELMRSAVAKDAPRRFQRLE
jgi:hypothetical protein